MTSLTTRGAAPSRKFHALKRITQRGIENTPLGAVLIALVVLLLTSAPPAARAASGPLFQVAGVINALNLGTYISCTNTGTVATSVTIQVFDPSGTTVGTAGMATLNPQASKLFGTGSANGLVIDVDLGVPGLNIGSAQISSTQKSVMCDAFVADKVGAPPASLMRLTIIPKTKQRGD
jgi:hypothetical protein